MSWKVPVADCGGHGSRSEPGTDASPPEMMTVVPKTGIMPRVKRDLTFAEGRLDTVNFQVVDMRVFARATVQRSTVVDANVAAHIFERCCVFNLRQCILHTLFAYFLSLFHRSFSPPLRLNSPTRSMQNSTAIYIQPPIVGNVHPLARLAYAPRYDAAKAE